MIVYTNGENHLFSSLVISVLVKTPFALLQTASLIPLNLSFNKLLVVLILNASNLEN